MSGTISPNTVTGLNLGYVSSLLLVNQRAWDRLSPSVQATVKDTVREISDKTTKAMAAEGQDLTRKRASQMTETMPSEADVEDAEQKIKPYTTTGQKPTDPRRSNSWTRFARLWGADGHGVVLPTPTLDTSGHLAARGRSQPAEG